MNIATILQTTRLLFLDSAPVIYHVEGHLVYKERVRPFFDAIDAGNIRAVTTPITLAECLVIPLRQQDVIMERLFTQAIKHAQHTYFHSTDGNIGRRNSEQHTI